MFKHFKYETLPLEMISLDYRNPRIVTQTKLTSQQKIIEYLFEHEDLENFIRKIVSEGKNLGAERPYVIKSGVGYVVIEGNTRIAAYKLLTGLEKPPKACSNAVPRISPSVKKSLATVDCTIAPDREALLPIMASAHFGTGDKSKWGYLGSRKAVHDQWKSGKTVVQVAKAFNRSKSDIQDFILDYQLYLEALKLDWTTKEKAVLLDPGVEFNPPVRFLQTTQHKEKVGISFDTVELKVKFSDTNARGRFKHLLRKLVIQPQRGLGATATYADVFQGYIDTPRNGLAISGKTAAHGSDIAAGVSAPAPLVSSLTIQRTQGKKPPYKVKPGALLNYRPTIHSALLVQLMKEAALIDCKKYPACATFLLRNIIEAILKHIIDEKSANPAGKLLDLEMSISICMNQNVSLPPEDRKVLKEFQKQYLSYLNLGAHGNIIPNTQMVLAARDLVDQFIKRNV